MDQDIAREFKRLNNKIDQLTAGRKKATWAKVSFVFEMTGWNREKLRQARNQRLIEWKDDEENGRLYNLDSIPEMFLKKVST